MHGPLEEALGSSHVFHEVLAALVSLVAWTSRETGDATERAIAASSFGFRVEHPLAQELSSRGEWACGEAWLRAYREHARGTEPTFHPLDAAHVAPKIARLCRLDGRLDDAAVALASAISPFSAAPDRADVMATSRSGRAVALAVEGGGEGPDFADLFGVGADVERALLARARGDLTAAVAALAGIRQKTALTKAIAELER